MSPPRRPIARGGLSLVPSTPPTPVSVVEAQPVKKPAPPETSAAAASKKKPPKALPVVNGTVADPDVIDAVADDFDDHALSAAWPEAVLVLSDEERDRRVRRGLDTVLLDEVDATGRRTRGFVRAVLRVPLGHPKARVYGIFVEVDRAAYSALQRAFTTKTATRVVGRLATRLPFLDDAYGTDVELVEDGSDARARVVAAAAASINDGPQVGPRARRPSST